MAGLATTFGPASSKINLHRGNGIPRPRDRPPKIAFRPETVSAETETQPQEPANCGLLGRLWEICRFERLRGGLGRSTSGEQRQRLTARCGRFGPIDAQKEFSTMPAPPSARHKKRSATARRARGDARGRREGRLMRSRHKPKPLLSPQGSWPEVQWRVFQQRLSPCHSGDSKCSNHLCPDCDHTQK
jgi:hypothetical protein